MKKNSYNYVFVSNFPEELDNILFILFGSIPEVVVVCQVVDDPDDALVSFVLKKLIILF
jgi:hypothetical protein